RASPAGRKPVPRHRVEWAGVLVDDTEEAVDEVRRHGCQRGQDEQLGENVSGLQPPAGGEQHESGKAEPSCPVHQPEIEAGRCDDEEQAHRELERDDYRPRRGGDGGCEVRRMNRLDARKDQAGEDGEGPGGANESGLGEGCDGGGRRSDRSHLVPSWVGGEVTPTSYDEDLMCGTRTVCTSLVHAAPCSTQCRW